jgi:hypothetical protein
MLEISWPKTMDGHQEMKVTKTKAIFHDLKMIKDRPINSRGI